MNETHKPNHIAIIPDGNRRWAVERGKAKIEGHTEGAKNIKTIIHAAINADIPYLTVWLYSTENLLREKKEVAHLLYLSGKITDYVGDMMEENIRVRFAGDRARLPKLLQKKFHKIEEKTKDNTGLNLTFAVAYGGRDDMVRATRKIIEAGIKSEDVTEELFNQYIDLAFAPPIDLVIRTGGHSRTSGGFPWQSTYAELYFTKVYWPAFDGAEFKKALEWFSEQESNMGK